MLRLRKDQPSLWESVLPEEVLKLSEELTRVDALLEDERFFAPFREEFYTRWGRSTVPVDTYLRMMYLKFRYKLGYKALVREVKDSFTWRRFCRLAFNDPVPDGTTLVKLTQKYGQTTVRALNEALVLKLKEEKVVRGRKLRLDTTVVEANIHYPTDAFLLGDGIRVITRAVKRIKKAGLALGVPFVNHTRKVKRILSGIFRVVRERVSSTSPRLVKAEEKLLGLAKRVVARGKEVQDKAREEINKGKGVARRALSELGEWLERMEKVIGQTEAVLRRERHLPQRLVSLFDPGARPIVRGKARAPVEFGRKLLVGETEGGIISTYQVLEGNPADSTLLRPVVKGHRRLFRKRLKAVTTDRGFYSRENEDWLKKQAVKRIALPFRGRADEKRRAHERQPWFRRLLRFRAGSEGRASLLQRKFGLDRSLMRGTPGTEIWVGFGILSHNL